MALAGGLAACGQAARFEGHTAREWIEVLNGQDEVALAKAAGALSSMARGTGETDETPQAKADPRVVKALRALK